MAQPTTTTLFAEAQERVTFSGQVLGLGQAKNPILPWLRMEGAKGGAGRSIGIRLMNADVAGKAYLDAISPAGGGALPDNVRAEDNQERLYWYVNSVSRTRFRKAMVFLKSQMMLREHDLGQYHQNALKNWYAWWSTLYMSTQMSCGHETIDQTPAGDTDAEKITAYEAELTGMTAFELAANQVHLGRSGVAAAYAHINAAFAHATEGIMDDPPENSWDDLSDQNLATPFMVRRAVALAVASGVVPLNGAIEEMDEDIPSYVWFVGYNGYHQLLGDAELIDQEKYALVRGPDNPYFTGRKLRKFVYQNQIIVPIFFQEAAEDLENMTTIRTEDTNDGLVKEEWIVCGQNSLAYAEPMWFNIETETKDYKNEIGCCIDTMEGVAVNRVPRSDDTSRNQTMSVFCTAQKITR